MSTSVVVEALPPPPPPSTGPADAPATAIAPPPTIAPPSSNGARSPAIAVADLKSSSNSNGPTPPSGTEAPDVEMATVDASTAAAIATMTVDASAVVKDEPVATIDAITEVPAESAVVTEVIEVTESITPMEVDSLPTNDLTEPQPKHQPVAFTVRSPEDDARALALAKRRLEIQIAFVENMRTKIDDESHPDFRARMIPIDAERERLLDHAEQQERYWANCTSVIFAYECDEASSEFLMNCDKLRHEMLDEIHHEIEIINDQRKGSSSARKTTRKTRSARSKAGGTNGSDEKLFAVEAPAHKVKKRVGNVFQQLENKLAQSEVDHDLRELHSSMDAVSKKRRIDATESPFVAKYHRANFLYRDAIYQEGDEIFVRNLMNGSDYIAVICSITSTELFVLSEKGKYFRVVLMDLRQGRVVVGPLTPDQVTALNDRDALRM